MNHRPRGYEPRGLPGYPTPLCYPAIHHVARFILYLPLISVLRRFVRGLKLIPYAAWGMTGLPAL